MPHSSALDRVHINIFINLGEETRMILKSVTNTNFRRILNTLEDINKIWKDLSNSEKQTRGKQRI